MAQQQNWEKVREWILHRISEKHLVEGDRVPPEPEIAETVGVGRHSVRRATSALAAEGVLSIEQGRGTFVRPRPVIPYRIGRRTRFRENLRSVGLEPGFEPLSTEIVKADADLARELGLEVGAPVVKTLRRLLADGEPICLQRGFHAAERFPEFGARQMAGDYVTDIYRSYGVEEYQRHETEVFARLPARWEARLLMQHAEEPVMIMSKIDVLPDGAVVGSGESIWRAGRVRLRFDPDGA